MAFLTLHTDLAPDAGHHVLHDRQPQPRAAQLTAPGLIDPVKPFEDPFQVVGGKPFTGVGADDGSFGARRPPRTGGRAGEPTPHRDVAAFGGRPDGVADEVGDDLTDPFRVDIAGSGDVRFGGTANNPDVSVMGSGDVWIAAYTGTLNADGAEIRVGQAQ